MKTVHVIISGRVQGVWYRAWTQKNALKLNLEGWVRNRRDGTVEAVFSGPVDKVDAMLEKCRKGPPLARVDRIDQTSVEAPTDVGFNLLSTI